MSTPGTDHTGKHYGAIAVLRPHDTPSANGHRQWLVRWGCCGREIPAPGKWLTELGRKMRGGASGPARCKVCAGTAPEVQSPPFPGLTVQGMGWIGAINMPPRRSEPVAFYEDEDDF